MRTLGLYFKQVKTFNDYPFSLTGLLKNYSRWKKLLGANSIDAKLPWMTFDAIDMLNKIVTPEMRIFEYGSGGSTLFFAERAAEIISVEHNEKWMKIVESKMIQSNSSWKGLLILPEKEIVNHPSNAEEANDYISSDEHYIGFNFKKYASAINAYPENYFDIVVIDGRARPSCIMHSVSRIKPMGWMVIDNTDRLSYQPSINKYVNINFELILHSYGPTTYIPNFTMTSIWRKKNKS